MKEGKGRREDKHRARREVRCASRLSSAAESQGEVERMRIGNAWRARSFVASALLQSVDADNWTFFSVLEICVTVFLFGCFITAL